jgi:hypothetical protein
MDTFLLFFCPSAQTQQCEQTHYRLSDSDLLIPYLWKDLADVTLKLRPHYPAERYS